MYKVIHFFAFPSPSEASSVAGPGICWSTLASRSSILRSKAVSWFSITAAVRSPLHTWLLSYLSMGLMSKGVLRTWLSLEMPEPDQHRSMRLYPAVETWRR